MSKNKINTKTVKTESRDISQLRLKPQELKSLTTAMTSTQHAELTR